MGRNLETHGRAAQAAFFMCLLCYKCVLAVACMQGRMAGIFYVAWAGSGNMKSI